LLLFRAIEKETGSDRELILAGALTGIAFLTEVSNVVLFGVLLAVLLARSKRAEKTSNGRGEQMVCAVSLLAAVSLPAVWMARNRIVVGDFTATQEKVFYLGWVAKPWSEIWHHPIFTFPGCGFSRGS
jgi:4-amino-4-deoxy-L-arabinose transferase-like glycosyltransferase